MDAPNDVDMDKPIYYFAADLDSEQTPVVEVHKSWPQGHQALTISVHETLAGALAAETEMVDLKQEQGLDTAMREAERRAVAYDFLDPARADGRLFTEGPPDPFTTQREQNLAALNYTYDIVAQPQGTYELQSLKTWEADDKHQFQSIALGEFDHPGEARAEQDLLRAVGKEHGQEAEMREIERIAVENGTLSANRADPRLFTEGPLDPFTTQRQEELEATKGYYFRAGPVLDQDKSVEAYSLNLVNVEREGETYHFSQVEYLRVALDDAGYLENAANRFNHLMLDHGVGPAVSAANTWTRDHGAEPDLTWQDVEAAQLDHHPEPVTPGVEMDTQPLPVPLHTDLEL